MYYRVLYSNEYAKKKGKFGIVDIREGSIDEGYLEGNGREFDDKLFEGVSLIFEGQSLADFQMTYFPWRLVSQKMYSLLMDFVDLAEVKFVPVPVYKDDQMHPYYYMHFVKKFDVLDRVKTGSTLMHPKLDLKKVKPGLNVFCYTDFDAGIFCISEKVKQKLEANSITGCEFQNIS